MKRLAVIGAGSWGTALSLALAPKFDVVHLWGRDAALTSEIQERHENARYLPAFRLPSHIQATSDLELALKNADLVFSVVPSQHTRAIYGLMLPYLQPSMIFVSATKGIENETLLRMSEIILQVVSIRFNPRIAVLSGPTFAKEIASGDPTAVVVAAKDVSEAKHIQAAFSGPMVRCYASSDIVGVEIGAALKNVIAIGAGICHGLGLGGNSVAALITRGLAELTRLAVAMGGRARTLAGLAGLGDLVLTATGDLSRNRFVGLQLGSGKPLSQVLAEMSQVAEGVHTCKAAYALSRREGVQMPITEKMYEILYEGKSPSEAIRELMDRPLTSE